MDVTGIGADRNEDVAPAGGHTQAQQPAAPTDARATPRHPATGVDLAFLIRWKDDGQGGGPYTTDGPPGFEANHLLFETIETFRDYVNKGDHEAGLILHLLRRFVGRFLQVQASALQARKHSTQRKEAISQLRAYVIELEKQLKDSDSQGNPERVNQLEHHVEGLEVRLAEQTSLAMDLQNQLNDCNVERKRLGEVCTLWTDRARQLEKQLDDAKAQRRPSSVAPPGSTYFDGRFQAPDGTRPVDHIPATAGYNLANDLNEYQTRQSDRLSRRGVSTLPPNRRSQPPPVMPTYSTIGQATSGGGGYRMKVPDPPEFSGDKDKYLEWRQKMVHKLKAEESVWVQQGPQAAISYIATRLTGTPYHNVEPYLPDNPMTSTSEKFHKVGDILGRLDSVYGIHHRDKQARQEYSQLQKAPSEKFDVFLSNFQRLVVFLHKTEDDKMAELTSKLDDVLWRLVRNSPEAETMEDLIELCRDKERIILDSQFRKKHTETITTTVSTRTKPSTRKEARPSKNSSSHPKKDDSRPSWAPDLSDSTVRAKLMKDKACFDCGSAACRRGNPDCKYVKWRKDAGLSLMEVEEEPAGADAGFVTDPDESSSSDGDFETPLDSGNEMS